MVRRVSLLKQNTENVSCMISDAQLFDRHGNRKYLNTSERLRFYRAARRTRCLVERVFLLTLYYTGCRISEAIALTPDNFDFAGRMIVFQTLKQRSKRRFRALTIPGQLAGLLRVLIELHGRTAKDRLFPFSRITGWRHVKDCMVGADLHGPQATPRGLRHGYAIAAVSREVPLPTVQKWLGHTSLKTTGIYLNFVGEEERKLASRTWPRLWSRIAWPLCILRYSERIKLAWTMRSALT